MDEGKINGPIPEIGQALRIPGLPFDVTVTKVKETSYFDGRGQAVLTIFVKAPSRQQATMLNSNFINSQTSAYAIVESGDAGERGHDHDSGNWNEDASSMELGKLVRKYFPGHGWFKGEVSKVDRCSLSGDVRYNIHYAAHGGEPEDEEDLSNDEYQQARAYAIMVPPPEGPPEVIAAQHEAASAAATAVATAAASAIATNAASETSVAAEEVAAAVSPSIHAACVDGGDDGAKETSDAVNVELFDVSEMDIGSETQVLRAVNGGYIEMTCKRVRLDGRPGCQLVNVSTGYDRVHFDDDLVESLALVSALAGEFHWAKPGTTSDASSSSSLQPPILFPGASSSSNGEATTSSKEIVPYVGQGGHGSVGEAVASSNNQGLKFTSSCFEETLRMLKADCGKKNDKRIVAVANKGASLVVYSQQYEPFAIIPSASTFLFPSSQENPYSGNIPTLNVALADIGLTKGALIQESAVLRGGLYYSSSQETSPLYDNRDAAQKSMQTVVFIHCILEESNKGPRFFGGNQIVASVFDNESSRSSNGILVLNMRSIKKRRLTDKQASTALGVSEEGLRALVASADASFAEWYNGGKPTFENGANTRIVGRSTGPLGNPFIEVEPANDDDDDDAVDDGDDGTKALMLSKDRGSSKALLKQPVKLPKRAPTKKKLRRRRESGTASSMAPLVKKPATLCSADELLNVWDTDDDIFGGYEALPAPAAGSSRGYSREPHHTQQPKVSPGMFREQAAAFRAQAAAQGEQIEMLRNHQVELAAAQNKTIQFSEDALTRQATAHEAQARNELQRSNFGHLVGSYGNFDNPNATHGHMFSQMVSFAQQGDVVGEAAGKWVGRTTLIMLTTALTITSPSRFARS